MLAPAIAYTLPDQTKAAVSGCSLRRNCKTGWRSLEGLEGAIVKSLSHSYILSPPITVSQSKIII
jgi:hypothetical protein